ncbi:glycosyltransferase family 4 protein [Salinadaptatus halalkaliphilus]|uniref:Glycosyltransferase family 4 protein n=1 Tax=Salinadaptatus halalkaliphilus TaxID=2419781 RepID=A0A4S3TPK0_9EURY|nr:glycosyltransferase [Salinadaptatus halalkaliphilus]THE65143.1 glycosyltransferase family 4 protein [Salinadaptatus halalkaliphilus]
MSVHKPTRTRQDTSPVGNKLLVIAHNYSNFTKGQIDAIADRFDTVLVAVRYNRFTELSAVIDSDTLKKYGREFKIADSAPENVEIVPIPLTYAPVSTWYRYLGKHHYWATKMKLGGRLETFDVVHAHFSWTAGYVATKLATEFDMESVITVHENEDRLYDELRSENDDLYWTWENADAIIRVNEKDCAKLARFNDDIYAIPNGYDRDRFPLQSTTDARTQLGVSQDAKIVFSVGGLIPRKRYQLLIEAIADTSSSEQVICAIGGRGKERAALEDLAETHSDDGLEIRILGFIPDEALAAWMNACDIFALASESEGNPTVMFEALGCGKPYVGTNVGGVDEIITEETYGLLCDPDDKAALTDVLQRGLENEWDRDAILEYGRQYSWDDIASDVYDVYRDAQE